MNKNTKIYLSIGIVTGAILFFIAGFFINSVVEMFGTRAKMVISADDVDRANVINYNMVKNYIKKYYYEDIDEKLLLEGSIEGAISGMTEVLEDPYTVFYNAKEMENFNISSQGSYVGIGVTVFMDDNDVLTVSSSFPNSPARDVGVKKGDKIVEVDGEDVTRIGDSDIIISKIKGAENTQVKITIYREEEKKYLDFDITRKVIEFVYSESKMLSDNVGYLHLKLFDNNISEDFSEHIKKLENEGAEGIILDLRDNPGGDYYEVIKIADMLLPEGLIVYTEDRNGKRDEKKSDPYMNDIPIVVLTNQYSASASEILTAALKDYDRAVVVGTTTFGKGLVQSVVPLEGGAGLKITTARYFTPNGICIHDIGVEPNISVELDEKFEFYSVDNIEIEDDLQLQRALVEIENKLNSKE